jgi:hypothetical protein
MITLFYYFKANQSYSKYGTLLTRTNYGYSENIPINFNFRFVNSNYTSVTITSYGYIFFSQNSNEHIGNTITALFFNGNTQSQGGIYYQNLYSQSDDFYSIQSNINRINSSFVPLNIFRITYDNVSKLYEDNKKATFQIILVTDSSKSYVVLKYTSCLSNDPLTVLPGIYYLGENGQQLSNLMTDPCLSSNINQNGTWVFDVTSVNSKYKILI